MVERDGLADRAQALEHLVEGVPEFPRGGGVLGKRLPQWRRASWAHRIEDLAFFSGAVKRFRRNLSRSNTFTTHSDRGR